MPLTLRVYGPVAIWGILAPSIILLLPLGIVLISTELGLILSSCSCFTLPLTRHREYNQGGYLPQTGPIRFLLWELQNWDSQMLAFLGCWTETGERQLPLATCLRSRESWSAKREKWTRCEEENRLECLCSLGVWGGGERQECEMQTKRGGRGFNPDDFQSKNK